MNVDMLLHKQEHILHKIASLYHIPQNVLEEVKSLAGEQDQFIVGYNLAEEAFIFSDGELYTLAALRMD